MLEKQEKKIVDLMREIKDKYPNEYYRLLGKMEGLKVVQEVKMA